MDVLWCNPKNQKKDGRRKVMEFRELLYRARLGDQESIMEIFEMYEPVKKSL